MAGLMLPLLLLAAVGTLPVADAAAMVSARNGDILLEVDQDHGIRFAVGGQETTLAGLLAQLAELAKNMTAAQAASDRKFEELQANFTAAQNNITSLQQEVAWLKGNFSALDNKATNATTMASTISSNLQNRTWLTPLVYTTMNRHVLNYSYKGNVGVIYPVNVTLGRASVLEVLTITLSDAGCNGHGAVQYQIHAVWGLQSGPDRISSFLFGHAQPSFEDNFDFMIKPVNQDTYDLVLQIQPWGSCSFDTNHTLRATIQSDSSFFTPQVSMPSTTATFSMVSKEYVDEDFGSAEFRTAVNSTFSTTDFRNAVSSTFSSTDFRNAVNSTFSTTDFRNAVNTAIYTYIFATSYTSVAAGYNMSLGVSEVDEVLSVIISDVGCGGHGGIEYNIHAVWGLQNGPDRVEAYTFGHSSNNFEDHFNFFSVPVDQDTYSLFLSIGAWTGGCLGSTHQLRVTLQAGRMFRPSGITQSPPSTAAIVKKYELTV